MNSLLSSVLKTKVSLSLYEIVNKILNKGAGGDEGLV